MKTLLLFIQKKLRLPFKIQISYLYAFALFALLGAYSIFIETSKEDPPQKEVGGHLESSLQAMDTYLSTGQTLVPLEIANGPQLKGLLGDLGGLVDLYSHSSEGKKKRKIAQQIKIIRSPHDADSFAVLIDENKVSAFLTEEGPYFAVIHNPQKNQKTTINEIQSKSSIEIEYFNKENP